MQRLTMPFLRRTALRFAGIVCAFLVGMPTHAQPAPTAAAPDEFRITLLGTGSPAPVMHRFGPGVLLEAGGKKLLIPLPFRTP